MKLAIAMISLAFACVTGWYRPGCHCAADQNEGMQRHRRREKPSKGDERKASLKGACRQTRRQRQDRPAGKDEDLQQRKLAKAPTPTASSCPSVSRADPGVPVIHAGPIGPAFLKIGATDHEDTAPRPGPLRHLTGNAAAFSFSEEEQNERRRPMPPASVTRPFWRRRASRRSGQAHHGRRRSADRQGHAVGQGNFSAHFQAI